MLEKVRVNESGNAENTRSLTTSVRVLFGTVAVYTDCCVTNCLHDAEVARESVPLKRILEQTGDVESGGEIETHWSGSQH